MFFFSEGFTFRNFVADVFAVFLFVLWFWLLIIVISDLFRRHDISGWVKAIWVIALIVFPYLGIFAYMITQSRGMAERGSQQAQQARDELRRVVGFSVADEIEKLDRLKKSGTITDQEYSAFAPSWWHRRRPTIAVVPTWMECAQRRARKSESGELVREHLNERRDPGTYQEH